MSERDAAGTERDSCEFRYIIVVVAEFARIPRAACLRTLTNKAHANANS